MNKALIQKNMTKNSGFSLMELMMVIAIIGIMSALVIPMLFNAENRIKKVARTMYGDMERVKMIAVKNNTSCRMFFGADGYTIQDDAGNTLKTVNFTSFAEGVTYGTGTATLAANSGATPGNPALPANGIGYAGAPQRLTFNSRGTSSGG